MKIVTRYILCQILTVFVVTIVLMILGFILFILSEATIKGGLPIYLSIRLIPYSLPLQLSIILPVAILLACSIFYAKMAGSNEIIALKALGVPPWRIFLPAWILAFVVSCVAVGINDLAISWGKREMMRVFIEGTEAVILGKLAREHRFSDPDSNFTLTVTEVTPDAVLVNPTFSGKRVDGEMRAESGRLTVDFKAPQPVLRVQLNNVVFQRGETAVVMPGRQTIEYSLSELALDSAASGDPPMAEVNRVIAEITAEKERRRRKIAAKGTFALVTGNYDRFGDAERCERLRDEQWLDSRIHRCRLSRPRSFSAGFSSFFFVWVGIPLAVWLNRSDYFTSFFACFLPILIVYYPLLTFGVNGAKDGILPPWFCWSGNVVLGVIGCLLLKKIHRH